MGIWRVTISPRMVAKRLSECVRSVDTVARLGGDEFVVVQVNVEHPEEAATLAAQIAESLSAPCDLDGQHVTTRATIGIALTPTDGTSAEELLRHADIALYRAKLEEPGTWRFFEAEMGARVESRRQLEMGCVRRLCGTSLNFSTSLFTAWSRAGLFAWKP